MSRQRATPEPSAIERGFEKILDDCGISRKGGRPRRFKPGEVAEVLRQEGGVYTAAARRLGCDHETVAKYADRYASVRKAREDGLSMMRSLAEGVILDKLRQGDEQTARWVLRSQLGGPEWREAPKAVEVGGVDGATVPAVLMPVHTFANLEEWAAAARPAE